MLRIAVFAAALVAISAAVGWGHGHADAHKRAADCDYHRDMDSEVCYLSFHNLWTGAQAYWAEAEANGADISTYDDVMRDWQANDGFMDGADTIGMNCKLNFQDEECLNSDVQHFWDILMVAPSRCYLHYGPELVFHNWTSGECQQAAFGPLNRFTSFDQCLEICKDVATCNHYDATTDICARAMDNIFEEVNEGSRKAAEQGINWLGPGVWHVEIEKVLRRSPNAKYIKQNCDAVWPDYRCRYAPHGKLFTKIVVIDIDEDVEAKLEGAMRAKIVTDDAGVFYYDDDILCVDVYTKCPEHKEKGWCDPADPEFAWVETGCRMTCELC